VPRSFVSVRTAVSVAATCAVGLLSGPGAASAQPKSDLREIRDPLVDRMEPLIPTVRAALQGNNPDAQRAALAVVGDFPPGLLFQANLSRAIAGLLDRDPKDPELTALAVRSYGKSYPESPEAVTRVLGRLVASEDVRIRRAVADALRSLLQNAVPNSPTVANAGPFIDMSKAVLPLAGRVVEDGDGVAQRAALSAVQTTARVVIDLYTQDTGRIGEEPKPKDRETRFAPLRPVLQGLGELVPKLAAPLGSPEPPTRMAAARTVEVLAALRAVATTAPAGGKAAADPLADGWPALRPAVTERMRDPNPDLRLAVTEALEALGGAFDAKAMLREATTDRNLFVRWAAARALGKTAPPKAEAETVAEDVAALSRLLADADMDVRMAALNALARFGPAARSATPAVIAAARRGDVEPRVVALRTLAALQTEAGPTVPVLIRALGDPDVRLRRAAATGLVRFGSDARPALPELRRAVTSTDQELRLAAAEAILAIERPARLKDL
jgi:HEAT repeat protein